MIIIVNRRIRVIRISKNIFCGKNIVIICCFLVCISGIVKRFIDGPRRVIIRMSVIYKSGFVFMEDWFGVVAAKYANITNMPLT